MFNLLLKSIGFVSLLVCIFLLGNITRLVLRGRLNLSELVANKLFAIVFQINYVMSEEFAKPVVVDNADDPNVKKKRVRFIERKVM